MGNGHTMTVILTKFSDYTYYVNGNPILCGDWVAQHFNIDSPFITVTVSTKKIEGGLPIKISCKGQYSMGNSLRWGFVWIYALKILRREFTMNPENISRFWIKVEKW